MHKLFVLSLIALFVAVFTQPSTAGPPLICHPLYIGDAASLPSGDGPFGSEPDYVPTDLPKETLSFLGEKVPVIVRMETIRRAVLYATRSLNGARKGNTYSKSDQTRIAELAKAFSGRLESMKSTSSTYAHALFDLGYWNSCLKYASAKPSTDGYSQIRKAIALLEGNAEMEFACALICQYPKKDELKRHVKLAHKGAEGDPLLAKNLENHFGEDYSRVD